MFRFLLRPLSLAFLVTLLIWLAVIIYWQQSLHPATAADIGLYLLGMPLLAVGLIFGARAAYRHHHREQSQAKTDSSAAPVAAATDERERGFHLNVIAVGAAGCGGNGAAEIHAALREKKVQPMPDAELRNRDGFPVTTARTKELDVQAVTAVLETIEPHRSCPAAIVRALALMQRSLAPVFEALTSWLPEEGDKPAPDKPALTPRRLAVELLLPREWSDGDRTLAVRYFGTLLAASGWPAKFVTLNIAPCDEGSQVLRRLDAICVDAHRTRSRDLYLLVACDSAIDEDVVSAIEARGDLFSPTNAQGRVPGEGAAAILVCAEQAPVAAAEPVAEITRSAFATRKKSADESGRIGFDDLVEIARQTIEAAKSSAEDIALVVSDVDHRGSRNAECAGAINGLLPELDPFEHFVGVGQSVGRLGVAEALFALSVAVPAVSAEEKAVLVMLASHPKERAAVIVRPRSAAKDAGVAT